MRTDNSRSPNPVKRPNVWKRLILGSIFLVLMCGLLCIAGWFVLDRLVLNPPPQTVQAGLGQTIEQVQAQSSYHFHFDDNTRASYAIQDVPINFTYTDARSSFSLPTAQVVWMLYPQDQINSIYVLPRRHALTWEEALSLSQDLVQRIRQTRRTIKLLKSRTTLEQDYATAPSDFDRWYLAGEWCDNGEYIDMTLERIAIANQDNFVQGPLDRDRFSSAIDIEKLDLPC